MSSGADEMGWVGWVGCGRGRGGWTEGFGLVGAAEKTLRKSSAAPTVCHLEAATHWPSCVCPAVVAPCPLLLLLHTLSPPPLMVGGGEGWGGGRVGVAEVQQ